MADNSDTPAPSIPADTTTARAPDDDLVDLNTAALEGFRKEAAIDSALLPAWRQAILLATEGGLPVDLTPLAKMLEVPANDPVEQSHG